MFRKKRNRWRRAALIVGLVLFVPVIVLAIATERSLMPLPATLDIVGQDDERLQFLDRNGVLLNTSYAGEWNVHQRAELHEVPSFLRQAFIHAEDKRFYAHEGVDWAARLAAVASNLRHMDSVRGASTITEQVVRMLHPRPRTVWSRWVEGVEAGRLEKRFSKDEILSFYLNQVPFASRRRGVNQAAEFYFARDLDTLSDREMLSLAVLVRAPSVLDLRRNPGASDPAIERLAGNMLERGVLTQARHDAILESSIELAASDLEVRAPHFLQFAAAAAADLPGTTQVTTLDGTLQRRVQDLLDSRVQTLARLQVRNGAALVADNATGDILAWVVAGGGNTDGPESHIDPILTPRQPGSTLKPLLYALALENGHTLADVIVDAPLAEGVGDGLHRYRNYSERYYGPVTLRDALANSLNIPAIKLLHDIGPNAFLDYLKELGINGLDAHPNIYGDGLALGNGEVTLLDLVQAYQALASSGRPMQLHVLRDDQRSVPGRQNLVSAETASLIANVLSDSEARATEFGHDSVLNLPVQTAVKTGTSSDYRDAWIVGFDSRYTVGIWMGNLDRTPTNGVTGSIGPALLLRSVFALLNRDGASRPLYLSPQLTKLTVCGPTAGAANGECVQRPEWFSPAHGPATGLSEFVETTDDAENIRLRQPTPGLELALDPRLPAAAQAFRFRLEGVTNRDRVEWTIDGDVTQSEGQSLDWPVSRGPHSVSASIIRNDILIASVAPVTFNVR